MTTFALVHGAWGSGWHWASIPDRLRAAGHEVVAPDLPCDDVQATFDDYTRVVLDAIGDAEDVVVVGFSLGSQTAARVAVARPVRALVHVAGVLPAPGMTLMEQFAEPLMHREYVEGIELIDKGWRWADLDVYRRVTYDESVPEEVVAERFARLRPQMTTPYLHAFDADLPPAQYVMCTRDRLLDNAYWRRATEVTHEIESAHQVMVSQPERLTEILLGSV